MHAFGVPSRSAGPCRARTSRGRPRAALATVAAFLLTLVPATSFAQRIAYTERDGQRIYAERCAACHMPDGSGSVHSDKFNGFPPLTGMSEWMNLHEGQRYVAHAILYGPYGGVVVGGQFYFGMMPRFRPRLDNGQVVAVIRYVAETLNTPLPGYVPIDVSVVEEARHLEDTIDAVHEGRYVLPPR